MGGYEEARRRVDWPVETVREVTMIVVRGDPHAALLEAFARATKDSSHPWSTRTARHVGSNLHGAWFIPRPEALFCATWR